MDDQGTGNNDYAGSKDFHALLNDMRQMHIDKNAGYAGADNPDPFANFRECERFSVTAFEGCMVRLSDKFIRVTSLMRDPTNERVGEKITDTLMDLASYSLIAIVLWKELEKERTREA